MNGMPSVSSARIYNDRTETLFYLTLFVTAVHAGFILWDFVTLLPPGPRLLGLTVPNTVYASPTINTLYLGLLGSYAGYKEFLKWMRVDGAAVPREQALRLRRGYAIVVFWVALLVVAESCVRLHLVSRLPNELGRTATQALGIMLGTFASAGLRHKKDARRREKEEDAGLADEYRDRIVEHIKQNGFINNDACQGVCTINRHRAYRLLKELEAGGVLKSDGVGRAIKYTVRQ